jgi:Ser/Thr protein kinase RdoA (MazF antagonist)
MTDNTQTPYAGLTPDVVLDAMEAAGFRGDGRLQALGSYENRVYQVMRDDEPAVVVKFYRPGRWSDAQIAEEHAFVLALAEREIPAVAPLITQGRTLHTAAGFRFAVYEKRGGRPPELDRDEVLVWLGRYLARIHTVGAGAPFASRPALSVESFGDRPRAFLLDGGWLPEDLREAYATVSAQALDGVRRAFARAGAVASLRLHGDVHAGNVLWSVGAAGTGPHFVDFDDARMGPAVQDLWMLLSGDREMMEQQMRKILEGYEQFRPFDRRELHLVEALRTLRLIHYAAWIAERWDDPAFPAAFPWFNTQRYWQDRILELREQVALLDEPPLMVG